MTAIEDVKVMQGGLMRCCLETIQKMFTDDPKQQLADKQIIDCRHEKKPTMIVNGDTIKWLGAMN